MIMRIVVLACALSASAVAANAAMADVRPARCEAANLRVYFSHSSSTLNSLARETLATAEANMADCDYAEVHVRVDAAGVDSQARGQAVLAALNGRSWNVARIEPRNLNTRAAMRSSPEHVEVAMTPEHMPVNDERTVINPNVGA